MTPRPPPRDLLMVKHAIIDLEALQNAWRRVDLKPPLESASHAPLCLWCCRWPAIDQEDVWSTPGQQEYPGRQVSTRHCQALEQVDDERMGYTVEPPNVPIWMLPRLVVRDLVTPMLLGNDMQSKLQEGSNHICWGKRHNRSRRSGNPLNMSVLPQNPLWQVTHHPLFSGHDPSRVPAHVLKRCHLSRYSYDL